MQGVSVRWTAGSSGESKSPPSCTYVGGAGDGRSDVGQTIREGFPTVGSLEEPGVYPTHICPDPEPTPEQLLTSARWGIKAGKTTATYPNGRALRTEALARVEKGWFEGPYQFNEEGSLETAEGPQLANPAFRFWSSTRREIEGV